MHYLIMEYEISLPLWLWPVKHEESQNSSNDFQEPTTDLLEGDT
jgi:hypothetical protein